MTRVARQTFADLLKIPLQPPGVDAMVRSQQRSGGLITEDLDWESLDGERVPAYVIRPERANGPLPAILCLHGSSGSRDSMATDQFGPGDWIRHGDTKPHKRMLGWARELARRGFVALAMTQRGLDSRGPAINTQANLMLVEGRTAMGAVLHEIRQATTYLQRRPDVDPQRIGATGMSFGGITAFYMWIIDDRVTAAAPICGGVGSIATFMQLGRPSYHGTYWWVPDMLCKGDQADFAAALAPKPLMLWSPTEDVGMPREGVDRFVEQVRPAYERLGKSDAFVVHQQPGEHSFSMEAFEALTRFFRQQFGMR
ncbi:MAG: alpha/beta hydrolase family protein [Bryobacterales bacterium]